GKRNSGDPWFELYDLKGQCVGRRDLKGMGNKEWYFNFLGTSAIGKVLFLNDQRRISIEIPSLKVSITPRPLAASKSGENVNTYSTLRMVRGSNRLYELEGNIGIRKMSKNPLPHELRIKTLDI